MPLPNPSTTPGTEAAAKPIKRRSLYRVALLGSVRSDEVIMGHHDLVIEAEDHVIVFVIDKGMVRKVEKLFQVNIGFF